MDTRQVYREMLDKQRMALQQVGIDFDSFQLKSVEERRELLFNLQREYLGNEKKINSIVPIVSVCVATYQHVNYIKACIEGAVMQKTKFPIEIIIGDDGSVDGTTEICKQYAEQYPDKIRFYDRNREMCRVFDEQGDVVRSCNWGWTLKQARGKYIAICEGDDYWIDPLKLQKQVDFLESNPEYSMCSSNCYYCSNLDDVKEYNYYVPKSIITLNDLLYKNNMIFTLTVLYRADLMKDYDSIISQAPIWPMGDYPKWIWLSTKGPIYKMPEKTAVYRILDESASHSKNIETCFYFGLASYEIRLYFCSLLKKCNFPIKMMKVLYVLKFIICHWGKSFDKLKYLFILKYSNSFKLKYNKN